MTTLTQLLRYLVSGSDELYLPETWLAKTDQLRRYDHWTKRQRYQGSVTADVEAMRRRAFWKHVEAKRNRAWPDNVIQGEWKRSER